MDEVDDVDEVDRGGTTMYTGPMTIFIITVSALIAAVLVLAVFLILDFNRPLSYTTDPLGPRGPRGERGPIGVRGPVGLQGAVGPQGDTGPQGPQGLKGDTGDDGICLGNFDCDEGPQGPVGPAGPAGADGAQGIQGLPGIDGAQGPIGPQGYNGSIGPVGPAGPAGPVGPQGPNGTCDGTGTTVFDSIILNGNFTLNGDMTCAVPLGADCVIPDTCPDHSACDIVDRSNVHRIHMQVGQNNDTDGLGATGSCNLGRRSAFGDNWNLQELTLYSLDIDIAALQTIIVYAQDVVVTATNTGVTINGNNYINLASGGGVSILGTSGVVSIVSASVVDVMVITASAGIQISGTSVRTISDDIRWEKGGSDIFMRTRVANTHNCITGASSISGDSVEFDDDIIISNEKSIVSDSGPLNVGPTLFVCGSQITGGGDELILGNDTLSLLYIAGPILPRDNETCVTIGPTGCTDIRSTITNSDGPVDIDDDLDVSGDTDLTGTLDVTGEATFATTTTVEGQLEVDVIVPESASTTTIEELSTTYIYPATGGTVHVIGNLNVTGVMNGAVLDCDIIGACPSDMRFKHRVVDVDHASSLHRVMGLEVLEYEFLPEFAEARKLKMSGRIRGFSAQQVEETFPQAVIQVESDVAPNTRVDDLRLLKKEEMLPDLWNTVQYLVKQNEELRLKLDALLLATSTKDI
jgi:hypothetical protein